ncbi:hypothetical protein HMPREF0080_01318 [Anaeroglobus geminatus F0357]|uniref:Uncharacterized protein n=1 Tax=Anaeroglobus geminatus F0357 TaxID=861450 RepID=G9YI33_9FIRM|nr:hypothetical protein HMPREF0080_01318 [Anaeroglobus geminatus F0357]
MIPRCATKIFPGNITRPVRRCLTGLVYPERGFTFLIKPGRTAFKLRRLIPPLRQ